MTQCAGEFESWVESPSYSSPSPAASLSSSSSSTLFSTAFSSSAAMAEHQAQAASSVARCSVLCGDIVLPTSLITLSSLSSLKIKCQPDLPRQLVDVVISLDKGSDASNRIGSEYIHVIIPYVAFSHSLTSQIQLLYPKNAIVTLPGLSASDLESRILYRPRSNDYPYFIAEAGPCELQVLSFFPDSEITYSKSSAIDALNLSERGDFYFRNKDYGAAAQLYGFSIEKASACVAASLLNGERIRDVDVLVSAHCGRAECFLQLGMLIEAYDHCSKALDLDRYHFKSAVQRAKALHQMQEYSVEFVALVGIYVGMRGDRSDNIDRAGILGALRRSKTFREQSAGRGEYGEMLKKFFMNDANWSSDLECSDYLGPVEIRLTGDGRGRGLFATKDLEAGSLVLVSNAMALARWLSPKDDCNSLEDDVVTKLVQRCMRCKEDLEGLYALQGSGSEQRERRDVPSMSLFGSDKRADRSLEDMYDIFMRIRADSQQQPKVDAKRIKAIVNCTAYKSNAALIQQSNDITNERGLTNSELFCGLWLLPGFINHSCIANLSRLDVGESAFFHATREIKAGDELTVCYTDVHLPWASFRKQHIIKTFGFECNCRRCAVEAAYDVKLRPIVSDVYTEANMQLVKERDPDAQRALAGLAAQIEVVIRDASQEEKDIIRAAYMVAYLTYYKMQPTMSGGAAEEVDDYDDGTGGEYNYTGLPPRKSVLARALRSCVPGDYRTISYLADVDQRPGWTDFRSWIGNDCAGIHGVNAQVLGLMKAEKWPWQRRLEKQLREREPLENQGWGQYGNTARLDRTIRDLWHRTCTIWTEMLSYY
ncbi:hypothetical protein L7F22_041974 [Adiantum nelumboides]|nr:hypothetical protein [Adiantum nelumboides]